MTLRMVGAIAVTFWAVGAPSAGSAQIEVCGRNLSTLDTDIGALEKEYRVSDARMQALMAAVDQIQDTAMNADICPERTSELTAEQRADVASLSAAELVARSESDMWCSQVFVQRVSQDIAKAQGEGNSAMVVRLNTISQRILDLDSRATQVAMSIAHLASRKGRLMEALDLVDSHCGQMDSIYE
ncbi:putative nucleic acid-binding protein [Roseovarius sp. MBR-79]